MDNTVGMVYVFSSHHCGRDCSPGMEGIDAETSLRKGPGGNQPGNVDMQQAEPNPSWSQGRA